MHSNGQAKQDSSAGTGVQSLLAMATEMRRLNCSFDAEPLRDLYAHQELVPLYAVGGESAKEEAAAAVQVLEDVSDRLRRLQGAYGEWSEFDAGAYFDLTLAQTRRLVRVSERVSTVHVTFYVDQLLPSFVKVESYWYDQFCPAYRHMREGFRTAAEPAELVEAFTGQVQPTMVRLWSELVNVIDRAYERLLVTSSPLIAYLCEEERARRRIAWRQAAVRGIDASLQPELNALRSLTISIEFPLPMKRQPGRVRRLRTNRARKRPADFLRWRALDG